MKARDVMTRNVRTATPTTPVSNIERTMIARRISALPVVDRKRHVLGIVGVGGLLRRVDAGTERRHSWWSALLAEPASRAQEYVKSRGGRLLHHLSGVRHEKLTSAYE